MSQGYVCHSWFAPDVTDDPALQEDVGSNSGESVTVVDAKLGGNATIEVVLKIHNYLFDHCIFFT